jgi:pimeloyl-ACP methyl ester carboxylesterase
MTPKLSLTLSFVVCTVGLAAASVTSSPTIVIRGHEQTLHVYGSPSDPPVIVSSGDGGWMHLGPHVAAFLAQQGFYVVGFDVRAYLSSFTSSAACLKRGRAGRLSRARGFRDRGSCGQADLVGVSEGAGLSVLAASDPRVKDRIAGVVGLGLPDRNELGWRWKDSLIYVTHKAPEEPSFSSASVVSRVTPIPVAIIQSTHDEYVSFNEMETVMHHAAEPKRLWVVDAADHSFSNNLSQFDQDLLHAVSWVLANRPH